jgi:hypothetical protein
MRAPPAPGARVRLQQAGRTVWAAVFAAAAMGGELAAQGSLRATPAEPAVHRLDEAYFVMRHNSYADGARLTDWLDAGHRAVELDVIDRGDWENEPEGPFISHEGEIQDRNCAGNPDRLGHCLRDIAAWLEAHPDEGPVLVFVDLKAKVGVDPFADWRDDEMDLLDHQVRRMVGDRLYGPGDLYRHAAGAPYVPGARSLRQAVSERGWPTLSALAGRMIVLYTGGRVVATNQTQGAGLDLILARRGLPHGFFCPDVEADPGELEPGGVVDGMSASASGQVVCSNMESADHYQVTANAAFRHRQLIHLYGGHVFGNDDFSYNYVAVAHGISAIGRDAGALDTFGGALPLVGVRRSLPGYFELRPLQAPGRCLDVSGAAGAPGNGTVIHLWDCHGGPNQQFVYTAEGQLRPRHANRYCVDIRGGTAGDGRRVHLWRCDGGWSERWSLRPDATLASMSQGGRFCLAASGFGTAAGTEMVTRECHGGDTQQLSLSPLNPWPQNEF